MISTLFVSGCIKRDDMDNIDIITTSYPITYLTNKIYGNNSTVTSIYPNGIDINDYEITDKQIKEAIEKCEANNKIKSNNCDLISVIYEGVTNNIQLDEFCDSINSGDK